jgi:hypothetical protein
METLARQTFSWAAASLPLQVEAGAMVTVGANCRKRTVSWYMKELIHHHLNRERS